MGHSQQVDIMFPIFDEKLLHFGNCGHQLPKVRLEVGPFMLECYFLLREKFALFTTLNPVIQIEE